MASRWRSTSDCIGMRGTTTTTSMQVIFPRPSGDLIACTLLSQVLGFGGERLKDFVGRAFDD